LFLLPGRLIFVITAAVLKTGGVDGEMVSGIDGSQRTRVETGAGS
jgi:hypothetical protein